jgi:hypothetical protein
LVEKLWNFGVKGSVEKKKFSGDSDFNSAAITNVVLVADTDVADFALAAGGEKGVICAQCGAGPSTYGLPFCSLNRRFCAWSASSDAGAARRHPIRLARYTQAGRFLRSHVMALAQLVAAVIDNLTLTNWGSHKNNVRFPAAIGV